jgi:hypothetical protein
MILAEAAARPAGTFAEAAVRLAGLSAVLFGWTPDAFWRATPAELRAPTEMLAGALAGTLNGDATAPPDGATLARLREQFPDG